MQAVAEQRMVTHLEEKILLALLYFDVFNYPLKSDEVFRFLGTSHASESEVQERLIMLRKKRLIFQFGDLFSVQNNESNAIRRLRGNTLAEKYQAVAMRYGRLISRFPFVRAVFASGSLSKGYMDQNSDLDYFIVTKPGRLWIARTLLVLYKRVFLFNSHKHFCVNYFVDTDHLEIEEKNLFTATELATVIPLYGSEYYKKLHQCNPWLHEVFPNYSLRSTHAIRQSQENFLKRTTERLLNIFVSDGIEKFFKGVTLRRWMRVYGKRYADADFLIAFKTKDYASKTHPNNYQQKVKNLYSEKVEKFSVKLDAFWKYE